MNTHPEEAATAFKRGVRSILQQLHATDFLTLVPNRQQSFEQLAFLLRKVCTRAHEKVLRRAAFSGRRTDELHRFVAVFEETKTGVLHVHLATYSDAAIRGEINEALKHAWRQRFPAADSFHRRDFSPSDIEYLLKDVLRSQEHRDAFTTSWHLLRPLCRR